MVKHNLGLSRGLQTISASGTEIENTENSINYGRVVEVILDMSHKRVKSLGGTQALYGVFYQPLFVSTPEDLPYQYGTRFAYCGQQNFRQIPIKGEIVQLEHKLAAGSSESTFKSDGNVYRTYWTAIVPVWNHPHLNIYPDVIALEKSKSKQVSLGKDFKENADIKPLQLNDGDVTLEGRHGQSIRLGGTVSSLSPIATNKDNNNGKPYTIIRNGQKSTQGDTVYEDVNDDDSSIYLVSDHKVPITEANRKFKGAVKVPELTAKYQGKQIVENSDRIVINAREDNLVLAAKKHASVNADTVSIDGEQYVGLDAKKIYLGTYGQTEKEPVLKGQVTMDFLKELYQILYEWYSTNGAQLGSIGMTAWEKGAGVSTEAVAMKLKILYSRLSTLGSKKVFTE